MKRIKEEYTLKYIETNYNIKYIDRGVICTLEENIAALTEGINEMNKLRTYTGILSADVLETELKKYVNFFNKIKRKHPEYFI